MPGAQAAALALVLLASTSGCLTLWAASKTASDPTPTSAPTPTTATTPSAPTPTAPTPTTVERWPYDTDKVRLTIGETSCTITWQRPPRNGETEVYYEIRALGTVSGPQGTEFSTDAFTWDQRGGTHIYSGQATLDWGGYGTFHTRGKAEPVETDWSAVWGTHDVLFHADGSAEDREGPGTVHDKTTIDLVTSVTFDDGTYAIEPETDHTTIACPPP